MTATYCHGCDPLAAELAAAVGVDVEPCAEHAGQDEHDDQTGEVVDLFGQSSTPAGQRPSGSTMPLGGAGIDGLLRQMGFTSDDGPHAA